MSYTNTITSKGQVTIPKEIRDQLGLVPGKQATFRLKKTGEVVIERPKTISDIHNLLAKPNHQDSLTPREKAIIKGLERDGREAVC